MPVESYDELTNQAIDYVSDVCTKYGPRISATKQEHNALEELQEKLEKFADFTYFDSYKVYPTFYPGEFVIIFGVLVILGVLMFFLKNWWILLAILLPTLGLFILFVSLVKLKYWFAWFSKKGISHNVIGRILPRNTHGNAQPSKMKIIIAGHMDSAFQMKITRFGDNAMIIFAVALIYSILVIFLSILKLILLQLSIVSYITQLGILGITWIDIAFLIISLGGLPIFLIAIHGFAPDVPVLGANDNLSGVGLALALGQYFTQDDHRLHNIELWVGSFGSEECGERGSEYFIKKYSKLGLLGDCVAIIPESLGAGTHLAILTKEMMHMATHDSTVCDYFNQAYQSLVGEIGKENVVPCRIAPDLKMGASDGGRFALAGFSSSTLLGYEGTTTMKPANWHNVTDIPQNLNNKIFRTAIGIYIHFVKMMDRKLD